MLDAVVTGLGDDGRLIVLYPGQTLVDVGIEEVTRDDIVVTFLDLTPVYTPLSLDEFTFVNPEDYSGTLVEVVPDLFTELLHEGRLVVPVITYDAGEINFTNVSLAASNIVTLIGPSGIHGLVFGEAFSAQQLTVQSHADIHIGGSLLGVNQVTIATDGSIYLEEGARIDAPTVHLIAPFGEIIGAEGSLVTGNLLYTDAWGDVSLVTDILAFDLTVGAGDVDVFDHNLAGVDKVVSLDHISTGAGTVRVTADSTIRAHDVAGNNIHLIAQGTGNIEVARCKPGRAR